MWDLDSMRQDSIRYTKQYCAKKGYSKGKHESFAIGDKISFLTGCNNDILACATIKGIDGQDLYVYNDCYWFPISANDKKREIKKLG